MSLTSSNVRFIKTWESTGTSTRRRRERLVELHGGTGGDATDTIAASLFDLSYIEEVSNARYGDATYNTAPDADNTNLLLWDPSSPSAPTAVTLPATPNGMYLVVKGY
jgi:hypothetical protein